ncbi:alpha-amylase family glycosyl hydrolase [Anaeromyxobacter diazotrophicus]|uniref:Alpha-amylase n=1 Tax=Anaeromyxobacter diazotrophicus TaxID=2590199 RepID=A0A7I9VJG7_9BACT|nr:alpha-amylase family glycosyl hydrolase [Anaeromyxobacter diazotrophicus]GEJ56566.1 alpha-amylase [Anaeromyxobacter diazotrophicus]
MSTPELRSARDIDFADLTRGAEPALSSPSEAHRGRFTPSPRAWEDLVFYFLLPDRFSDAKETDYRGNDGLVIRGAGTPKYTPASNGNAIGTEQEAAAWREAGKGWCGGNLRGLASKVGYLARMGVTAIWVGPVFKQVAGLDTYHGYAIQNFLQLDPRFGAPADLRELVDTAHAHGIYVVLDIVINHTGNVFAYTGDAPYSAGRTYPVKGFYDQQRAAALPFSALPAGASIEAAVWPAELQAGSAFHQRGYIQHWDDDPEFRDGDFFELKDLDHGAGDVAQYNPSAALDALCRSYCYWIAYADLDGFRVDTVKHVDDGAARYFASWIHEFAQRLGKDDFYLVAEITGSRQFAFDKLELTGLDAALGIADVREAMSAVATGAAGPAAYFDLFRNSRELGKDTHAWFRDKVITMIDDHDKVGQDPKARFCASGDGPALVLNALALNVTTLGIPCIYYGTEQRFDGQGSGGFADRYIREAMFGGPFGAFRSRGCHFFDEEAPVYVELAKLLARRRERPALRRGRQYLRPISGDGVSFGWPTRLGGPIRALVAWSRILDATEILCVMNTDPEHPTTAWVTVDDGLHRPGSTLRCFYSSDAAGIGRTVTAAARNGSAVQLEVPAAGFAMYE